MKWCEHLKQEEKGVWWITYPRGGYSWTIGDENMFCPICGTPRPKEKTLEEKMADRLNGFYKHRLIEADIWTIANALTSVANEHFNSKT